MKKLCFLAAICVALCCFFASCASSTKHETAGEPSAKLNPVYVTNKAQFNLLSTSDIEKKIDAVQHISAAFGKNEFESDCLLVADSEKLTMTLLNNFGTTMGELNYNNDLVVFNSELFPSALKAEYIVADVQFCFYRVDALQAALESIGLRFVVSVADGVDKNSVETRSIFDGDKEIVHIEKAKDRIVYNNILRGYSYTLEGTY